MFLTLIAGVWIKRDGLAHHLGAWRARSLLNDSLWAGERRDWKEAKQSALAAWQLNPGNIEILRQLRRACEGAKSGDTLPVAKALFDHPEAIGADRAGVIRLFLGLGDHVTVANLLSRLPAAERDSADALELGARFFLARNHPGKALPLLDRLRLRRNEPADLLLAAEVLTRTPTEGDRARDEAQRIIGELFRGPDRDLALKALVLLRRIPAEERQLYHFPEARERLEAFAKSGPVSPEAWFLVDELDLAAFPEQREAVVRGAIDRWLATEPVALGQWLLGLGEARTFLEEVPRSLALENPAMLALVVQAMILEERWDRALALLERAHRSVDPVTLFSLRAMIEGRLGRTAESNQNWSRATRYAELASGRESLLRLGKLALLGGKPELRDDALAEALKRPAPVGLAATDVAFLFPTLAGEDRDEDLLAISQNLLESEPDNPQLLNNVVWLGLLHGRVDEARLDRLARHIEAFPSIGALRTTLALAQVRAGKASEALETLAPIADQLSVPRKGVPESGRAVFALALSHAGEKERARNLTSSLDWSGLLEAEQEFFATAFRESQEDRFLLDEPEERD